jgi:UDP-3-O-[3-hydroxymyristoyl] glucosamine N-acyltransferase
MPELKEIATLLGGELRGDGSLEIRGVQALHRAGAGDIAYVAKGKEGADLSSVRAGALIVASDSAPPYPNRVLVTDPQWAFARLL